VSGSHSHNSMTLTPRGVMEGNSSRLKRSPPLGTPSVSPRLSPPMGSLAVPKLKGTRVRSCHPSLAPRLFSACTKGYKLLLFAACHRSLRSCMNITLFYQPNPAAYVPSMAITLCSSVSHCCTNITLFLSARPCSMRAFHGYHAFLL
jgi:hypothetical protein